MSGSRPTDEPSSCSCRPLEDSESLIKHWSLVHPHICVRSQVGNYLGITKNGEFYLIPWIETLNFTTEDFKSDTKIQKMSSCTNLWIQLKVFSYGLWGFVNSGDFPSCSSSTFTWWETVERCSCADICAEEDDGGAESEHEANSSHVFQCHCLHDPIKNCTTIHV